VGSRAGAGSGGGDGRAEGIATWHVLGHVLSRAQLSFFYNLYKLFCVLALLRFRCCLNLSLHRNLFVSMSPSRRVVIISVSSF
jgi:hypothetical protein